MNKNTSQEANEMTAAQPIVERETTALPPTVPAEPGTALTTLGMLNNAVASGASMEVLERLMAMHERWEANQARKSFDAALSAAKAEIPVITKNRRVDFTGKTGIRTNYRHEDLGEIARTVDPILARHGLSYRFRPQQQEGGAVTVTCILSHRDGYSEESTLSAGRDESGNKNNIQAVGSTVTYLQRYTLKMALGLAASDDDDGRASSGPVGPISEQQRGELDKLIKDVGANEAKFLEYFKVESLADLPASQYERAVAALEAKRAKP